MRLTTKLLLGVTVIAGLSISAFAACATDVDMGAKKLTNVADGTQTGEAVHYGQVLTRIAEDIAFDDTNLSSYGAGVHNARVERTGNSVCIQGLVRNNSGAPLSVGVSYSLGSIPPSYAPNGVIHQASRSYTGGCNGHVRVEVSGAVNLQSFNCTLPVNDWFNLNACWTK